MAPHLYLTRDLVGFRKGDVLVLDASVRAVASGETDARLFTRLQSRDNWHGEITNTTQDTAIRHF